MRRQLFVATVLFVVGWLNTGTVRGQDGPVLPDYQAGVQPEAARERYLAPRQRFKKKTSADANSAAVQAPLVVDDRGNVAPEPSTGKSRSKLLRRSPAAAGNADAPERNLRAPFGGTLSKAAAARIDRNRQIRREFQQNGTTRNVQPHDQPSLGQSSIATPDARSGDTGRRLLQQPAGAIGSMRRMTPRAQAEGRDPTSGQAMREGDSAPRWMGALSAPPTDSAR